MLWEVLKMKDLRELKAWLEERGEVAHVTREVDPEYDGGRCQENQRKVRQGCLL